MAQKIHLLSVLFVALIVVVLPTGIATTTPTTTGNAIGNANETTPTTTGNATGSANATTPTTTGNATGSANETTTTASVNETTTPPPATTPPNNPCQPNPCGDGSTCQPDLNVEFRCLCLSGEMYDNGTKSCVPAKVFPGEFQTTEPFVEEMKDKRSKAFLKLSKTITDNIQTMLVNFTSPEPVVRELQPFSPTSRSGEKAKAIVEIIFPVNSDVTTEKLTEAFEKGCGSCVVDGPFKSKTLCEVNACDAISSKCTSGDGNFTCECRPGYKRFHSNRACVAQCPIGEQFKDDICNECAFGYTGFNCEEHWKRDLVIVGSVLGGLLLISAIIAIAFATKKPKKSSKKSKNADQEKSFNSRPPVDTYLGNSNFDFNRTAAGNKSAKGFGNNNSEVPRIPRAMTNSGWDNRTNLEMTPSHSRQNLIAPSRPQNNPYAQRLPQVNPYAQNRGRTNASFM